MKSLVVPVDETNAIASRVERLLVDLGRPKPPISLAQVRALQKLDVRYYSVAAPDFLDRMAHKMRIAGKVITEPWRLFEAVKQMDLKALLLPDAKKILIDDDLHDIKKRWAEAHEVVHDLLDWHKDFMYGDEQLSLSPFCEEMIEAEANLGAGFLLYPNYFFNDFVSGKRPTIALARSLSNATGNSITSAGWRLAEHSQIPAFLLVSDQAALMGSAGGDGAKHLVVSRAFERNFSKTQGAELFKAMKSGARRARGGPLGTFGVQLRDDDGFAHEFVFDAFSNSHAVLTLAYKGS